MAVGRDDFVIAIRSAFLKKKDKQKFSLLSLIFLSIFVIVLSNLNFKVVKLVKSSINEVIYRSSFFISIPENYIQELKQNFDLHINLYQEYNKTKSELENIKQKQLINNFLEIENKKLRSLIVENIESNEVLAKVLIDKESPYLKSIVLNKGSKDNVRMGMAVLDGVYLVGQIIEVNFTNSRALLLSDLNSKIPSVLEPNGIQAVISGTGDNFGVIEHTQYEFTNSQNTDVISYTSGIGGLFKPGIPIGKMSNKINRKINFFSDFSQLDYVKISSYKIGDEK